MKPNRLAGARGLAVAVTLAALRASAQTSSPDVIDDVTTYSYAQRASGADAILPVSRSFDRPIKSLTLTIIAGQADDIGYVGGTLVTDVAPACRRVSAVVAPVDVSNEVTVSGNTASFNLIAQENCCCFTGWGPATEAGRTPATFHWHVVLEPACTQNMCIAQCATEPPSLSAKGSFDWTTGDQEADCAMLPGRVGGNVKLSAAAKVDNATCAGNCKSDLSLTGNVDATLNLCGRPFQLNQAFSYARSTAYDKLCDTDSCTSTCDPTKYCLTQNGSYAIEGGTTFKTPWEFDVGSTSTAGLALTGKCGFELGLTGGVKGTVGTSENNGSSDATCQNCQSLSGELSLKGSVTASCDMTLTALGWSKDLGCKDCASLDLTGAVNGKQSSCGGGQTCGGASLTVNAAFKPVDVCMDVFGLVAKVSASATGKASISTDSCTGGSVSPPSFAGSAVAKIGKNLKCGI